MKNKSIILLGTMRKASSRINVIKYSQDKKKKNSARFALGGSVALGICGVLFAGSIAYGLSYFGYKDSVPSFVASTISLMALFFTIFKSNGYLYAFKEYDMLMAMPFSVKTIVSDRFLLMYLSDLKWDALISIAALAGYGIAVNPPAWVYISWIILTPFVPLLPTVVASLLGVFTAAVGSRVRHKNLIQIILTFIILIPVIFMRPIIDYLFQNDKMAEVMEQSANTLAGVSKVIPTVGWFEQAINNTDIVAFILMIFVSLVIYIATVMLISVSYRRINSRLESSGAHRTFKNTSKNFRQKTMIKSIAYKEFKRITGSTVCATQLGFGAVITLIMGLILPFIDINAVATAMAKGHEVDVSPFAIVWPLCVYFFLGMLPSTSPSMSLEGKNYWIIKSLPVDMMTVCKGKMLFNIYMNLVPGLFAVTTGMIAMKADIVEIILGLFMITAMILFSTVYGMLCGVKHMNLEWENELDVVKKGTAVTLYLLPNMFATMALIGIFGVFAYFVSGKIGAVILIVLYALPAFICSKLLKHYFVDKKNVI